MQRQPTALGAARVVPRLEHDPRRPLGKPRYAAVVDTVGGAALCAALSQCAYRGAVASTGVAGGEGAGIAGVGGGDGAGVAGDGEGGDAARRRDGDTGCLTSTCFEADFGQLSALSRAGFAGDDNDGVFLDCGEDLVLVAADG